MTIEVESCDVLSDPGVYTQTARLSKAPEATYTPDGAWILIDEKEKKTIFVW